MRSLAWGVVVVSLLGCASAYDQLRTRAAFDLQCPEDKLQLHYLDDQTEGVRGCGRQATYIRRCNRRTIADSCSWVMNNEAQ